jgi:diaminopropionate ammonia-lyase
MAGLACGEASPLAWKILEPCVDDFMTISDEDAIGAMRTLAAGTGADIPLVVGESGAAGFAGLKRLMHDSRLARATGLNSESRVLVISTEGATAPAVYSECVGETADSVLSRQAQWQIATIR